MKKAGLIIIIVTLIWMFIASLHYFWWIWMLLIGFALYVAGSNKHPGNPEKREAEVIDVRKTDSM